MHTVTTLDVPADLAVVPRGELLRLRAIERAWRAEISDRVDEKLKADWRPPDESGNPVG